MAKKPDGAAAGTQRVTFTKGAAERIGRVVRTVEAGNRDQGPLEFGVRVGGGGGKVFRICTFTGSWPIGSTKTVTFKGVTSTPNTVSAQNVFVSLPNRGTQDCGIAKDGTAWHLIAWAPVTATATVITNVSLGTAGLRFDTMQVLVTETVSTAAINISTTTCA